MAKRMFILGCSGLAEESQELELIKIQAELYKIECDTHIISNTDEFSTDLFQAKYDYIYLSAHGNENGFGNGEDVYVNWKNFGQILYNSKCLNESSFLLLSCCRGGLNDVAYDLIYFCDKIDFVCGPRYSLYTEETILGFSVFLYNVEYKRLDPIIACEKIKKASDLRFICFDRLEVQTEPSYLITKEKYTITKVDLNNDGVRDEILIDENYTPENIYTDEDGLNQNP